MTTSPPPRRRIALQFAIGVVILAVVAVLVVLVVHSKQGTAKTVEKAAVSAPAPKNMRSDGVLIAGGSGTLRTVLTPAVTGNKPVPTNVTKLGSTANIVEYVDFQCPFCFEFEETNLANIATWVGDGRATLELHPIAILDRSSEGTRYSSRAANAAACVADYDPQRYIFVAAALYQKQPAEGTRGLTDTQLIAALASAGASGPAIDSCVKTEKFKAFVAASTLRAVDGTFTGVATTPSTFQGTPTVFVDGALYNGSITDAAAFTAFVEQQQPGTTN